MISVKKNDVTANVQRNTRMCRGRHVELPRQQNVQIHEFSLNNLAMKKKLIVRSYSLTENGHAVCLFRQVIYLALMNGGSFDRRAHIY